MGDISPRLTYNTRMELVIKAKFAKQALFTILAILIILHILGLAMINLFPDLDFMQRLVRQFDLNDKENLPTLFGGLLLLFSGTLLFIIGFAKRRTNDTYSYHWLLLGLIFLYLSIDESITLHKYMLDVLGTLRDQLGSLVVLLPLGLLALALGYFYWRFLTGLPNNTRWRFILAGGLYVGAAFGLQQLDEFYKATYGQNPGYTALTTLEESLELLGIVLFIGALLDYMVNELPDLKLKFGA
ncbi:MAG: hypothetical protein DWQ07_21240 [Chloroflexi bacterium]|nr:MAG: hypothetical protein DWQ07_21240 [Chloroflexota bacterium]MBL1194609.1 hypothetical protein [Chloroflexota bacterium]NOH11899.1 hypothetical protein [Chloroflexota bacterium]